jgi:hypothetical protein
MFYQSSSENAAAIEAPKNQMPDFCDINME